MVDATPISRPACQQGQVRLTHQRADADVADRQAAEKTQLFGVTQGGQGVGGFAGLGDGDEQGIRLHDDLAVAELTGDFDLARNTRQAFEPVTRDHAGVVAGAAGDDLHIAHLGEQLGGLWAERLDQHLVLAQAAFQGALHHRGLLVDFLEHEVAELALVGGFGAIAILHGFALDGLAIDIPDLHAVTADLGDVALLQVHEAVGNLAQRQLVGRQEVLAQAQADHQRAATASGNQAVRLLHAYQRQAIGTVQALDCGLERVSQVGNGLEGVVDQVDDDLGVGLGGEHITQALEFFTQLFVVFDNAVVHDRHFVTREMRVGIAFGRRAVGSPAGVSNAQLADQRLGCIGSVKFGDLADATAALQFTLLGINGQASTVVPTVLEALEAFDEDGGDVSFSYGTNDSTHVYCSWLIAAQIRLMPRA